MNFRRYDALEWTAIFAFLLMAVGCYVRLFISVGQLGRMDEMYWVASAFQSSLGGTPLINDLHMQQLCGLVYEPLVWLYAKLFGNFGVLLFVRHLYFIASGLVAALYFQYFRKKSDLISALATAALPLIGTSWAQPSLGYNSIGSLGFGAGSLLALWGIERGSNKMIILSGLIFVPVLGAYPTLVGALALLWLLIGLSCVYLKKPFLKKLILANVITAIFLASFVASLILRASFESLLEVYRFSIAHSSLGDISSKLRYGYWLMMAFGPPLWALLTLFFVWIGLWWWRGLSWFAFAIPLCAIVAIKDPPEAGTYHPALIMLMALSGTPLIAKRARRDFANFWPLAVLWLTGLLSAVLTCWSSAMTIYVTYVTATYCLPPIYLAATTRRWSKLAGICALSISVLIFFHRVVFNQRDDPSSQAGVEMFTSGPYAGLWTSGERYVFLDTLEQDIKDVSRVARSVLYYDEFPLGYLMSSLYPATRSLWIHTLRESSRVRPFFQLYYSKPENRPDVIFRFKYYMEDGNKISVEPEQFLPYEDVFYRYLPEESHNYHLYRERDSYQVYVRNSLAL